MTTNILGPILEALLADAGSRLDSNSVPVGLAAVYPGGTVAWDNCCESSQGKGQLYVQARSIYPTAGPTSPFPNPDRSVPCNARMLAARLVLGVVRCCAVVDNSGNPPSAAALLADSLSATLDAAILQESIVCSLGGATPLSGVEQWLLGAWTPQGARGGCAGGEWELTIAFGDCGCP